MLSISSLIYALISPQGTVKWRENNVSRLKNDDIVVY